MKSKGHIGGLLLAGGSSRRMGEQTKQLLPLGDGCILSVAVSNALESELDPVVVVLGYQSEEIRAELAGFLDHPKIVVTKNPRYGLGMSESIKEGIKILENRTVAGAMILLADQPRVTGEVIDRLIQAFRTSGKPICQPVYGGMAGNPVLFDRSLFPSLMKITGDQGGRSILREHPEWVEQVLFANAETGVDLDTPESYERFREESEDSE